MQRLSWGWMCSVNFSVFCPWNNHFNMFWKHVLSVLAMRGGGAVRGTERKRPGEEWAPSSFVLVVNHFGLDGRFVYSTLKVTHVNSKMYYVFTFLYITLSWLGQCKYQHAGVYCVYIAYFRNSVLMTIYLTFTTRCRWRPWIWMFVELLLCEWEHKSVIGHYSSWDTVVFGREGTELEENNTANDGGI